MVNWEDIHEDFSKKEYYGGKTCQQEWEQSNLTYQDAQEWIDAGFKPADYKKVYQWRKQGFIPEQVESWMGIGLNEDDVEFATYLRWKGYQPRWIFRWILNLKQSREEFNTWKEKNKPAQDYLDCFHSQEQRSTIKKLDVKKKSFTGTLNLSDFASLEELDCFGNQLTCLDLSSLNELSEIKCESNNLESIKFPSRVEWITQLCIGSNKFPEQDLFLFKKMVNLKELRLSNNHFYGSLEHLQKMNKLEILDIKDTDLDSGLEYLPESVKYFHCSADRKDAKCKAIYNLFADEKGEVETDINGIKNFPIKLQEYKQWRKFNFSEEEIKQWINAGFQLSDYDYPRKWKDHDFTLEEIKQWINAGSKVDDYEFVTWLLDVKNYGSEWITNYKEDYQILGNRFKKYGFCPECNQPNTGEKWCQDCNSKRFKEDFAQWTSHNSRIDKFIQKYQLQATDANKFLEWIPYKQFTEIKYLAEGGFGKVYKAKWTVGNIHHWDIENKQWHREKDEDGYKDGCERFEWNKKYKDYREVVLKSLTNSQSNTEFLQETAKHKEIDDWFNNIVPCYGISQDSDGNYLMVMQYVPKGNLRHYLSKNNRELVLRDKLIQLLHLAQGLKDIHQKNLVHRDFHSGNILKGIEKTSCLITDLGLCKPANEASQEKKIFGVMPYVAPEVLQTQPYTQASDVYSFSIVAYELLSGLPPYYDMAHDVGLAIKICQGLRPQFQIQIPQSLEDLIRKCWDVDPAKRPIAQELERTLRKWQEEAVHYKSTEFKTQLQAAEKYNQTLPDYTKFPKYKIHHGASYHSKLLPTKEITKLLLQNSQLIPQQNKSSELISKQLIKINKLAEEIKQNPKNTSELTNYFLGKSKELTKELEAIIAANPNISEEGREVLKEIKKLKDELKTQHNKLPEDNNIFEEQAKEISYLEARVQELTNLIKQKKEKIIGIFTRLLPDKKKEINLIQSLVIAHFEYTKAKKQSLPSVSLRRQRDKIRDELEELLGNNLEEEIEASLADCEELVSWELELEEKLQGKTNLIEGQKQTLLQITAHGEEARIKELKEQLARQEKVNQKQQIEMTKVVEWKQKHLSDLKEKNARITELEEQLQPQILHQPYNFPSPSKPK